MKTDIEQIPNEVWVIDFTEEAAQRFRSEIMFYSKDNPYKPITIYIDSYGGQVDALAKMITCMDEVPNPLVTVAIGKAMSCGAILLSHGDYRFCDELARIMIHEAAGVASGNVHDVYANATELKRLNESWMDLLAKNCGYSGHMELKSMMQLSDGKDKFLSANTAKKFGIIDFIGLPKIMEQTSYAVVLCQKKVHRTPIKKAITKKLPKSKKK